jgi:hypothetical protein
MVDGGKCNLTEEQVLLPALIWLRLMEKGFCTQFLTRSESTFPGDDRTTKRENEPQQTGCRDRGKQLIQGPALLRMLALATNKSRVSQPTFPGRVTQS